MGLDMYLEGVKYISAYEKINGKFVKTRKRQVVKTLEIYWRKANAIHNWFVNNIQEGEDDCRYYELEEEQLIELRNTCKKVLRDNSLKEELLPTQEGFFFGGTDYDEYYYNDLKETVKEIDRLLSMNDKYDWFEYCSSW